MTHPAAPPARIVKAARALIERLSAKKPWIGEIHELGDAIRAHPAPPIVRIITIDLTGEPPEEAQRVYDRIEHLLYSMGEIGTLSMCDALPEDGADAAG